MKNWKLAALLNTPAGLVIALSLVISAVELLIMEVIHDVLVPMVFPGAYWGFIDTVLLTLIVAPALYFLVFRKLHESEERFRQINASAQDAIVIINEQGMVTDWNLAAQKMFQYSREEAVGQQMHQLIAPPRLHADAARGFARFQETGAGPLIGKITELPALRKDGSEFYIEHSISAIKVQSRWHAIGVMRDITERKQAENKLAKSEQHFRAVTESANDAIITAADAGNIIGWNAAAGRLFGYTETEIIGQPLTVLMPERFRSAHSAGLARVVAGGTPHVIDKTVELAGLRKDGSEFPLEFSLAQWQAVEGQFFTAIIRDITERKGAEQTLIKSEALLKEMGRLAKVGGWEFNVETREVVWTEEVYRIHELDMAYKPTVDKGIEFYAPASRSIIAKVVQRAIEYGEPYEVELELITAKGNYRWVHTTGKVLQKHGKTITVFGTFQDITERKQAEAQLLEQLDDLRRWHDATIGREMRVLDLKHEVNELLVHTGQPPRYPSAESDDQQEK